MQLAFALQSNASIFSLFGLCLLMQVFEISLNIIVSVLGRTLSVLQLGLHFIPCNDTVISINWVLECFLRYSWNRLLFVHGAMLKKYGTIINWYISVFKRPLTLQQKLVQIRQKIGKDPINFWKKQSIFWLTSANFRCSVSGLLISEQFPVWRDRICLYRF